MNCCCASKTFCARNTTVSEQPDQFDELRVLLGRLIDDELDVADRARLADWLRHDAAARNYYLRYLLTDTALQVLHQAPAAGAIEHGLPARRRRSWHGLPARRPGAAGTAALPGGTASTKFESILDAASLARHRPCSRPAVRSWASRCATPSPHC